MPLDDSITTTELLRCCVEHGIPDRTDALRALHATLATLGSRLTEDEARALSATLPTELAHIVDDAEYDGDFDAAELYARAGKRSKKPLGLAREQTEVVLRVLGEVIDRDVRRRLSRVLPEPIVRALSGPERGEPPPHPPASHAPKLSTLATARPGSTHPLSESAPVRAHTHSVAETGEPHAETKLSSTPGLTQERLGDTLAEGEGPGPERSIAEASDD